MSSRSLRLTAINEDLRSIAVQLEALQIETGLYDLHTLSLLLKLAQEEAAICLEGLPPIPGGSYFLTVQ